MKIKIVVVVVVAVVVVVVVEPRDQYNTSEGLVNSAIKPTGRWPLFYYKAGALALLGINELPERLSVYLIAHFRVALSLSIKARPGAQPFI